MIAAHHAHSRILIPIRKAQKPKPVDAVAEAAAKLTPRMQQAYLAALNTAKKKIKVTHVAAAIRANDMDAALQALDISDELIDAIGGAGLAPSTPSMIAVATETFRAGAEAAMAQLPRTVGMATSFNMLNPRAVEFIENYSFELITNVGVQQRMVVQEALFDAFVEGFPPDVMARQIRDTVGLTRPQEVALRNFRNGLQSGDSAEIRRLLDRKLRDHRFDATLNRLARGEKIPKAKIDHMVQRYHDRLQAHRAMTIARTETNRASHKGQQELWRQGVEQGKIPRDIEREWVVSGINVCDICTENAAENVGMEEAWSSGDMEPPAHPNCMCSMVLTGWKD